MKNHHGKSVSIEYTRLISLCSKGQVTDLLRTPDDILFCVADFLRLPELRNFNCCRRLNELFSLRTTHVPPRYLSRRREFSMEYPVDSKLSIGAAILNSVFVRMHRLTSINLYRYRLSINVFRTIISATKRTLCHLSIGHRCTWKKHWRFDIMLTQLAECKQLVYFRYDGQVWCNAHKIIMPSLRTLLLTNTYSLTISSWRHISMAFPKLTTLELPFICFDDTGRYVLPALPVSLTALTIKNDNDDIDISSIHHCKNLIHLDIRNLDILRVTQPISSLTELSFARNSKHLLISANFPNLRILDIGTASLISPSTFVNLSIETLKVRRSWGIKAMDSMDALQRMDFGSSLKQIHIYIDHKAVDTSCTAETLTDRFHLLQARLPHIEVFYYSRPQYRWP